MIPVAAPADAKVSRKPRASGDDPEDQMNPTVNPNVNPARAGMIRLLMGFHRLVTGKPRASGDDPCLRRSKMCLCR